MSGTTQHARHRAPASRRGVVAHAVALPRPRALWLTVAVLALAVAVALGSAGGTFALWNRSASTSGGTITSGTATIAVGALSTMNTAALAPGTGVVGTFSVKNTGSVPLSMRVATTSTKVSYASVGDAAVLGELTLRLAVVATTADCRTGLSGASARLATFDTGTGYYTLPTGVSGIGCLEVDLDADAPQSVAGAVTDFTLTVTGTQVAP